MMTKRWSAVPAGVLLLGLASLALTGCRTAGTGTPTGGPVLHEPVGQPVQQMSYQAPANAFSPAAAGVVPCRH